MFSSDSASESRCGSSLIEANEVNEKTEYWRNRMISHLELAQEFIGPENWEAVLFHLDEARFFCVGIEKQERKNEHRDQS